jgi:four helix bundle protein
MTDQIRRSSRSVCTNLAEAWRRRRYPAHFASKVGDCESEAEETRVHLQFCLRCSYLSPEVVTELDQTYDSILAQLTRMSSEPERWVPR